ncbi:hypothetical protein HUU61_01120 [Rhodopseudomonas palustris]|nr:hypothetical protein [Rhodopseudomonas palustris]
MGNAADEGDGGDLTRNDSYRFYLITRDAAWSERDGKRQREHGGLIHGRQALRYLGRPFGALVNVITRAKVRRLARELELRGVCYDQPSHSRVTAVSIASMIETIDKVGAAPRQPQPQPTAPAADTPPRWAPVAAMGRRAIKSVATFLFPEWGQRASKYQPERHYMRGPGPKWREKQGQYAVVARSSSRSQHH